MTVNMTVFVFFQTMLPFLLHSVNDRLSTIKRPVRLNAQSWGKISHKLSDPNKRPGPFSL